MKYLRPFLFSLWFLSAVFACHAQGAVDVTQGQAPNTVSSNDQSLAAALDSVFLPAHRVFLTVAAEKVALPPGNTIQSGNPSLTDVTDAYRRSIHAFGSVTALAPPTMVVLNLHPDPPDIYAGLQPTQALKLLAASLDDGQWKALIGHGGLGLSDVTTDDQRRMFEAVFPEGSLKIDLAHPVAGLPAGALDLSQELPQVRLRLEDGVQMGIAIKDPPDSQIEFPVAPLAYRWHPPLTLSINAPSGAPQSAEIPNAPKPGQLDWNLPVLRTLIPLMGLKTVGDLVSRVGQSTHLELYADRRYEGQALTLLGPADNSAPAADLLRSLAFCVTGAFRQVGPAFVLSDDVVGVATRRQRLADFDRDESLPLTKKLNEAGDLLFTKHSLRDLTVFDDPLAPSPAQWTSIRSAADPDLPWLGTDLMMDQLTSTQQADIREKAQQLAQSSASNTPPLDLTRKMRIRLRAQLELLVPSLDSPVTTPLSLHDLFKASIQLTNARNQANQMRKPHQKHDAPVTLAQAVQMTARRAVLVQPHTLADLESTMTIMQRLGFNQLWLDVFSKGQMHLTSADGGADLLAEAIKETRGTGIQVFAVMDLIGWDASAPPDAVDLTVLGETSLQDDARQQQTMLADADASGNFPRHDPPVTTLDVTPLAPEVQDHLIRLVRALARRPGLAGFVWRNIAPEGYLANGMFYSDSPLGYTEGARLAFLRQQHADPIDVPFYPAIPGMTDNRPKVFSPMETTLPHFDNSAVDAALSQAWDQYRANGSAALMRALYTAASRPNSAPRLAIWVECGNSDQSGWYGLWNSPKDPLPAWKIIPSREMGDYIHFARSQSHFTSLRIDAADLRGFTGLDSLIYHRLHGMTWDGFTLDLTHPDTPSLSALSQSAYADNTKAAR